MNGSQAGVRIESPVSAGPDKSTREDYERVRKRPWPVGRKKTIVREDLIHDLQRGLLNFSFGTANVEDSDAEHCDGMLVAGNEPGVVRQVLLDAPICLRPKVVMCSNCGKI